MGAYNILTTTVACSSCKEQYQGRIQFKYGDTWQHEYVIGDKIKWKSSDIVVPDTAKVKVYGILESDDCPICGEKNKKNEYDIFIKNDNIIQAEIIRSIEDYSENEGNYKVLTE